MSTRTPPPAGARGLSGIRRQAVQASPEALVRSRPLSPERALPLLMEPTDPDVGLVAWAAAQKDALAERLVDVGGILFRGFRMSKPEDLDALIAATAGNTLEYRERSSPRSQVSGNIYTSTEHPASQWIFLHNENSYQKAWPLKIYFMCETAPGEAGETPIADVRRVGARIPEEIRQRFRERGIMYVRNYGSGLGLPWQNVFQTESREAVDEYCRTAGLVTEWLEGDRLRTRAVRPATARHPVTGDELWFNHATFFHVTTLEPRVRDSLLASFAQEDLPSNTFYGDGAPIEAEVMDVLREAYLAEMVSFPWQKGDVLMLDNMLVAHARAPFSGPRRILTGMTDPITREAL